MRKSYFTLIFLVFGFLVSAQTSSEVGITEGQLSVSLSGAANYTIPIAVPPGINGIVPQISLAYNSQGGNGVAGYGWNIAGISTISRIPSTKFHDGVIDPVDFNALDRFAFDGQRLMVKNGTSGIYGANKTEYETESFSNVKITSYGVHPNGVNFGPSYFIVEYPDGSKAYYGSSTDSCSITDWAITYWENPQGVRISYTYSLTNNMLDIFSIKYGTINTTAPINEIKFKYSPRKRVEQFYIGGLSVARDLILKEINVIGNGTGFRNYFLEPEMTSLKYDRLKSVIEKSGDNTKSYNPTVFNYDTTVSDVPLIITQPATLGVSGIDYTNSDYISGDFDDDGKTDIILYSKISGLKNKFTLFSNITPGRLNPGKLENVDAFETIFPATFLSYDAKVLPQGWAILKNTDKNCTISVYGTGSTSATAKLYEKQFNFNKVVTKASNWSYCDPKDYTGVIVENVPMEYISGDFNGDGLTDVIAFEKSFYYDMRVCNFGNHTTEYQRPLYQGGTAYFLNLDRNNTSSDPVNIGSVISNTNNKKFIVADFDGDGKSDIYVFEKNFIKIYTLNKDNKLVLLYQNTVADTSIVLDKQILFGDYNGDGKIDFVIPQKDNEDSWNFYFSTGNNLNKLNTAIGLAYYTSYVGYFGVVGFPTNTYSLNEGTFVANDFNGDGKTDILYQQNLTVEYILGEKEIYARKGESQITKLVMLENIASTGNSISFNLLNKSSQLAGVKRNSIPIFTSHNEINQNLEYSLISDNAIISFSCTKNNKEDVLLKGITNGNGVKETITYKTLQQDRYEPIYTPTALTETFPNVDIVVVPAFKVVSMLEKQSSDVYKKQQFFYSGAVSNTEGLGFLGFRSTVRTNWFDDNNAVISTITKNDFALRGANTENYTVLGFAIPLKPNTTQIATTIVKDGSYTVTGSDNLVATQSITLKPDTWIKPGSTFSARINEDANNSSNTPTDFITKSRLFYESELLSNKVYKIKNTTTKQYNGLDNTSSETYIVYDDNNNPLKSTTLLKESEATVQTTVSDVAYYTPTVSPYVVGRPSGKNQSVAITGDVMMSEELYFYENNLLTKIKKRGTNTDYLTEDNDYDAFGNITKKTITATGLTPRVTSYGYDPSGRFLTKSTDIEGLSTSFVYNLDGTLQSETNPYGLTTSYLYDSWFRKTATIDYLKNRSSYTYSRNGSLTIVKTSTAGGGENSETFDDLGRKVQESYRSIWGPFSYVDYFYDIYDRNYKTSEPHFNSYYGPWKETKYDVYGRVKQSISATGKITDILYSGLTTTVNDDTKSKITVKNAIGNIVSMEDKPGGTVKYTYFANGNLKESDYAGVKTTIKQDGWGRKIELNDSSAGVYSYEYNAFGETTTETTPNGATTYILDEVGKLYRKIVKGINTDSHTTYFYDFKSKLLENILFTDITNGSQKTLNTIVYDNFKRINKTIEATPYATFTKEYTYDGFGRSYTETSTAEAGGKSSSKKIKKEYTNGLFKQLTDDVTGEILWQTNTTDARGKVINAQSGPLTITDMYDKFGFATQFKYDKTAGSTNILTLTNVFDVKKGNLKSRTNSLFNRNESFEYDEQDRLIEFTNAQGVQEKQSYDDQGRITTNSLGTYTYTKEKPYQNASITVTPEALSYYTTKPTQIITYNAFKSPVLIDEKDTDKISFEYNDSNSRSAMFYGGLQDEKLDRPLQKYYSADGSMEIKFNKTTGVYDFVTYIGGDGYSAPIVLESDGTTQEYLYLQRDYQGSIVAITNQAGAVVEKRLFDAWGTIVIVQDGAGNILAGLTILDRGYTGHEHLQSVGLINMNGRIYDPKLHRFLQPDNFVQDPFSTQSFNRYGYCWNNPLLHTDPSGEIIPLIVVGIIVVSAAINVYQNWDNITGGTGKFSDIKWGKLAGYTVSGAASGALTVYGGPYGVVIGAGVQSILNSSVEGLDMEKTVMNTLGAVAGGFVTRGIGLKFDANFSNGIIGGNNAFNAIITGTTREVVSSFSGSVTNDLISTKFANPSESFKKSLDPVNLGFSALGGGLTGLNGFASQPSYITQTQSPLLNSLELKPLTPFYLNPSLVVPHFIIPTRNVIPPSFQIPKFKPQFKG